MVAVAAAVALGALDEHVAQKLHLDFFKAGAATVAALALRGVEAKRPGRQLKRPGLKAGGEQFANVIERADVHGRVRARRAAQRRLIDHHHGLERPPAGQPGQAGVRRRAAEFVAQGGEQAVANECCFAGAADAGHANQAAKRDVHREVAQVVPGKLGQAQSGRASGHRAGRGRL